MMTLIKNELFDTGYSKIITEVKRYACVSTPLALLRYESDSVNEALVYKRYILLPTMRCSLHVTAQ